MREQQRRGAGALTGLFRIVSGKGPGDVSRRTAFEQLIVDAAAGVVHRCVAGNNLSRGDGTGGRGEHGGAHPGRRPDRGARAGARKEHGAGRWVEPSRKKKAKPRNHHRPPVPRRPQRPRQEPSTAPKAVEKKSVEPAAEAQERLPVPLWLWITFAVGAILIAVIYALWNWERLEVFQDAAELVLSAGAADSGRAGLDRVRARHPFGGGCGRRFSAAFVLAGIYRFIGNWREARAGKSGHSASPGRRRSNWAVF